MSLFDPDDEDETQGATSPFVERTDSVAEVPEAEEPGSTPLPPAGAQDSAQDYVSAPEGALPTAEQGPYGEFRSPVAAPEEAVSDGAPTDDSDWMKPIPVPEAVKFSPYKDSTADLDALKAQYAKEATENVKPSGWRRLAAGLAGGAVAYGSRNAGEGMNVANSVLDAPRLNAQERWQRAERPLAQQLASDQAENATIQRENQLRQQQGQEADRQYRNQAYAQDQQGRARNFAAQAEARRNAPVAFTPDDPSNPYAGGTVKTASGQIVKGQPPPDKWIQAWKELHRAKRHRKHEHAGPRADSQQNGLKPGSEQYNNFVYKTPMTTHTTISVREGGTPKPAMSTAQQRLILNTKNNAMAKAQDELAKGLIQPQTLNLQCRQHRTDLRSRLASIPTDQSTWPSVQTSDGVKEAETSAISAPGPAAPVQQQQPQPSKTDGSASTLSVEGADDHSRPEG